MLTRIGGSVRRRILIVVDFTRLALRSMASRWPVTLLNLVGIVLAVALLSNAGFFAQGVDRAVLMQELNDFSAQTGRDPFSLRVYFFPSSRKPLSINAAEKVASNLAGTLSGEIGLPLDHLGVQVESGSLMLLPDPEDSRYADAGGYLQTVEVVYVDQVAEYLDVAAGEPFAGEPWAEESANPTAMDVWMHADLAEEMGIDPGEGFQLGLNVVQPIGDVRVAGFWRAKDPSDPFWFGDPDQTMRSALLAPKSSYQQVIEPVIKAKSRYAAWHIILDDEALNPALASGYVEGFDRATLIMDRYLPGATLDVSPMGPLAEFTGRQSALLVQLLAFNLPALLLLLYFLILVAQIVVGRQQREISILVSRGMPRWSLLQMTLVEQLLLFTIAIPIGLAAGLGLARLMGYTASFLRFTSREPLPVSLQGLNWWLLVVALTLALLARLVPVFKAASVGVVEQERTLARQIRRPFWQRTYLDFILFGITAYIYRQLLQQGTFADLGTDAGADSLFSDPLLVLAPALFIITATLLLMRIFPLAMRLLDWMAERSPWLMPHLVLRHLGRHSAEYTPPLLLVIVLLALGVYMLTMAASLDQWLVDRVYFETGVEARFMPMRRTDGSAESVVVAPDTFDQLPGLIGLTRVGDYPMSTHLADGKINGRFLGVDRHIFSHVAWFRADFADEPLGGLMNRLAHSPDAVLVSDAFLARSQMRVGDKLTLRISLDTGVAISTIATISGTYHYFPTAEEDELVVIGNLDAIFLATGTEFPHQVWLHLSPQASTEEVLDGVGAVGLMANDWHSVADTLSIEQAKLERVGIFGTLSVGFIAAALMAILALVMYGAASLEQRGYQFGVLRALGLGQRRLLVQISLEYAVLTGYGTIAGTLIGVAAAVLFAPFFRFANQEGLPLPPLIPQIAWGEIMVMAVVFAVGMVVVESLLVARSLRRNLFDVLRMGQTG